MSVLSKYYKELITRINTMGKQRAEDTENTYFKKISVPNECRWISVLPLLGCPRRVFLMLQFIDNLVDKQSRKQKMKSELCHT